MSINSVAVKLGQEVGIDRIVKTAHDMGIKSKLAPTPALALGSSDVTLLELVNAYCTPVNGGMAHEPVLVSRILDRDGNEIYNAKTEDKQTISQKSAFFVQQLLQGGMHGTSSALYRFVSKYLNDTDFGGKTGTSNNHSDAWFIGTTPKLVVGAWVGGEYRCIHFRTGQLGQGNRTALPVCGNFLELVLGDPAFKQYRTKFTIPKELDASAIAYNCGGYFKMPSDSDSLSTDSIRHSDIPAAEVQADASDNPSSSDHHANQTPLPSQPQAAEEPKE